MIAIADFIVELGQIVFFCFILLAIPSMMAAICFVSNELILYFSKLRYLPVRRYFSHRPGAGASKKTRHFDGSHVIAYHRIMTWTPCS